MSLINEALKKAQKMRQQPGEAAPAAAESGEPVARVPKRRPPVQAKKVVIAAGGVTAVFALGLGAAFFFLLPDTTPPEILPRPARTTPIAAAPAPVDPVPTVTAPNFDAPAGPAAPETISADVAAATPTPARAAPAGAASNAPVSAPSASPDAAAVAPGTSASAPVEPPAAPPAPEPNPRVYDFLDTLRVAGIRASATDPKVLMNDRVYRLNDIVDRSLGLRITAIAPTGLEFTDEAGFVYEKNF